MTAVSEGRELAICRSRSCVYVGRVVLGLVACIAVLAVLGWAGRDALLRGAADLWIVSDAPVKSDAVAVFGGGVEYRPFAAAEYYRRGLAPKVLVSNTGPGPAERLGAFNPDVVANIKTLEKLGVPATAIETFGSQLADSYAEATALHEWAQRAGARTIMVPTDIFAARRLRWTLHHVFGGDAVILVPAIDTPDYDRDNWWRNERGVIAFQNEIIKYVYYRLKY